MGVSERREREKAALRQRIVDTARQLFAERGYDAVGMRAIAEAIEYSPTAIYLHFKDKRELFHEICRQDFGRLAEVTHKGMSIKDPIERLRRLGELYVEFAVAHPNHYRLMFMTPMDHEESDFNEEDRKRVGDPTCDGYAALLEAVRYAIERRAIDRSPGDAQLVAQTLWAAVHGVASLEITMHNDPWIDWVGLSRRRDGMLDVVLLGLGAKPSAVRGEAVRAKRGKAGRS
jgi:AcrR family transcriptional regulator